MTATLTRTAPDATPAPSWVPGTAALAAPPALLAWLTEPGLLTERVRCLCPGCFGLRIVDQRHDRLDTADAAALAVAPGACFVREIELGCGDEAIVFAQTLVPAATLAAEPWLAELGEEALGPRLARTGHARRDPLEFARLEPRQALFHRAWRSAGALPAALWARRARYWLGGHGLVVQEVFLPGTLP